MRVLVLCPHADDGELGCGGTLYKWVKRGADVCYAALSFPPPAKQLEEEHKKAMEVLRITKVQRYYFEWRRFHEQRQDLLNAFIAMRDVFHPDIVYCPATTDTHQDHVVVSQEAVRAFREITLLGYEIPRNNKSFPADRFEVLANEEVDKKISALSCYESQMGRFAWNPYYWRATAAYRGLSISADWAEAFEVIHEVVVD